jgi:hypothetical protein
MYRSTIFGRIRAVAITEYAGEYVSITSTVGAVRALEERIAVEEENLQQLNSELEEIQGQIAAAEVGYSFKKFWGTAWWLFSWAGTLACGLFFSGMLLLLVADNGGSGEVLAALIMGSMGYFIFNRRFWQRPTLPDLSDWKAKAGGLQTSISELESLIGDLRAKKRTLLLRESDKVEQALAREDAESSAPSVSEPVADKLVPVNEKECPMCAENVKQRAKICRFCGHQFEAVP